MLRVLCVLRVLRTGEHTISQCQFAGSAVPTEQRQRPARDARHFGYSEGSEDDNILEFAGRTS